MTTTVDRQSAPRARTFLIWLAVVIGTAVLLAYQRMTGPTYAINVDVSFAGSSVKGKLLRTHPGAGGPTIELRVADPEISGTLVWRRFPTGDDWTVLRMSRTGDRLFAVLPHMPTAGKVEYTVRLTKGSTTMSVPSDGSAVLRFRNEVPGWVLVLHVLFMFFGLLLGLRLLASALLDDRRGLKLFPPLMAFMIPGGLMLGPVVQKYAFGAYWTGWPVGEDLTDTKTLIAIVAWAVAWWVSVKRPSAWRWAVVAACVIMLAVYLIPHSVRGSQIDWSTMPEPPSASAVE